MIRYTLLAMLVIAVACSGLGFRNDALPYPDLADQRAMLAKKPRIKPIRFLDSMAIVRDLVFLASDSCEGRRPGTQGHQAAMQHILQQLRGAGTDSLFSSLVQRFAGRKINHVNEGLNIIALVKGTKYPDKYVVVSAHYDHLGRRGDDVFYGADDNASGVACLLAMARYFKTHPVHYSIVFALFDREESGLEGARHFVQAFPGKEKIRLNLNLDMIARSDNNEIFASGVAHYPQLKYLVDNVQSKTNVKLLMGHDTGNGADNWTGQSDHAAFHKAGIPYLYIGVEDHADYHRHTDTWQKINLSSYLENCHMVAMMLRAVR